MDVNNLFLILVFVKSVLEKTLSASAFDVGNAKMFRTNCGNTVKILSPVSFFSYERPLKNTSGLSVSQMIWYAYIRNVSTFII